MTTDHDSSAATLYPAPMGAPVSGDYTIHIDGQETPVYAFPTCYGQPALFAYCDIRGPVHVAITAGFVAPGAVEEMSVHPVASGIAANREENRITFGVEAPGTLTVLVNGDYRNRPLHLFFNPPVEAPPEDAIVFGPGMHRPGYDEPITLSEGQTLYLAGGAWVEGIVRAKDTENIRVMGRGVLSQSLARGRDYAGNENVAPVGLHFDTCRDVSISGIIETRAIGGWCGRVSNCDRVCVDNYHVVASVIPSTDGFNPCNSRDVTIQNTFFHTSDDCIAIKGNTGGSVVTHPDIPPATQPPVENIRIRGCQFWNDRNNIVVIGAESRTKHIRGIRVEDCDVLFHNKYFRDLGAFSITPLHGTFIGDIAYENIRIEHIENQLFCFRFVDEMYNIPGNQSFPGGLENLTIRNIEVLHQRGGPRSEMSGWSEDKPIRNVSIENVRYQDRPLATPEAMGANMNAFVQDIDVR